jgi:hypothetical protein
MKRPLLTAIGTLLPLILAAWAEPAYTSPGHAANLQTTSEPQQSQNQPEQPQQIEPIAVGRNPELVSPGERSQRLAIEAQQINQRLNPGQGHQFSLRDFLNLPDGMIIRASSRGGIGIGTEY